MTVSLEKLLQLMVEKKASDLHLKVGTPPVVRKDKALTILNKDFECLTKNTIASLLDPVTSSHHEKILEKEKQVDFSYGIPKLGRFRFNIFYQRGTVRAVVRHIPHSIPDFESLRLPEKMKEIIMSTNEGLILVTGAAGSGKTTSIMSMLDLINKNQNKHIVTIEDPIEFLISDYRSLISQRELGTDYIDYKSALKSALRQDPNIIFFGEIRCAESFATALTAANTGHLVFSTLHTANTAETITRILGFFNSGNIHSRLEFATSLKAIFGQKLIPAKDGRSFIPAVEILVNNPRVREILEDSTKSTSLLYQIIEESHHVWGMQSFDQHLKSLYSDNLITKKSVLQYSNSPERIRMFFSGISHENNMSPNSDTKPKKQQVKELNPSEADFSDKVLTLENDTKAYKKVK